MRKQSAENGVFRLGVLADEFGWPVPRSAAMTVVTSVESDSRRVREGSLFVAVRGTVADGHRYAANAARDGACALVVEEPIHGAPEGIPQIVVPDARVALAAACDLFFGRPSREMSMVGITGTNGKTTTAHLVAEGLRGCGIVTGLFGTVRHQVGLREIPAFTTTPGPVDLHSFLKQIHDDGGTHVVMEVSSHALAQKRVAGVRFAVAAFTNLSRDHLDYHGTLDAYRDAKKQLFLGLDEDAVAVFNADDPVSEELRRGARSRILRYGIEHPADVNAQDVSVSITGTRFALTCQGKQMDVSTPLIGLHNVHNFLAATACCAALEVPVDVVVEAMAALRGVPGRLEPIVEGQNFHVLVDYAHTEDGLAKVLAALRPLVRARLTVVFGCGGDRDRGKRPAMGRVAEAGSDRVILTSDNPRSEEPEAILAEIRSGLTREPFLVVADRRKAIEAAVASAEADDLVLLAGKGHEARQTFRDRTVPFDDRQVAREALREWVQHHGEHGDNSREGSTQERRM